MGKKSKGKQRQVQVTLFEQMRQTSVSQVSEQPIEREKKRKKQVEKEKGKKFSWKVYKRFFRYTLQRWKIALVCLTFTIVSGFTVSIFPWKVGMVLDLINNATTDQKQQTRDELHFNILQLAGLALIMGIFTFARYCTMQLFQQRLAIDIKTSIYSIFMKNDLYFFQQNKTGQLMSRLTSDINQAKSAISNNVTFLIRNFLTIIGNLIILFIMSWKLTLCILILIPIYVFVALQYTKKAKELMRKRQDIVAEMSQHVQQKFNGIQVVKSFCTEDKQIDKYRKINEQIYGISWTRTMYQGIQMTTSNILPSIGVLMVLWIGGNFMIDGESDLSPGQLTAFIMYCNSLSNTTSGISNSFTNIINGTSSCQKVFQMIDYVSLVDQEKGQQIQIDGSITFQNVSFSYPSSQIQIFHDLSLQIKKGQYVAFVGQSGSGKSTVIKLIQRFYPFSKGHIFMGDYDVENIKINHLRKQIGLVSQEASIFSGTVEENIAYGVSDYSLDQLERVAIKSGCMEFVSNQKLFPQGFQTMIGQRGSTLSGGQRQRISIARVLMHKPKLLIFDEATSALDSHSESIVQHAIEQLASEKDGTTIIVVAHRLSTVINCDKLFVMKEGKILETGSHSDLIGKGGYYYELIQKQLHEKIER